MIGVGIQQTCDICTVKFGEALDGSHAWHQFRNASLYPKVHVLMCYVLEARKLSWMGFRPKLARLA